MVAQFQKFNQAVIQEQQIKPQQLEAQSLISEQQMTLQQQKQDVSKIARQQVLTKGKVDSEQILQAKKKISQRERQLNILAQEVTDQDKEISIVKTQIKTPLELEKQGFKKKVEGKQVIYFKESTYKPKKDSKTKKTFIEEEYVYENGKPVKIITRDDFSKNGRRKVDEETIIEFQDGKVKEFQEFQKGKKQYFEKYDDKGRILIQTSYDDGKRIKKQKYQYDDKQQTVEVQTKKYTDEIEQPKNFVEVQASLSGVGTNLETEIIRTKKGGVVTISTIKRPVGKVRTTPIQSIKTTEIKKQPTLQTQLSQDLLRGINEDLKEQIRLQQTQTSTPEQIQIQQQRKAQAITGREILFSLQEPKEQQVNLNPFRIVTAPTIFVGETIVRKGANIEEGFKSLKQVKEEKGIIGLSSAVVVGTFEAAATDPFGFVGESVVLGEAGGAIIKPIKRLAKIKSTKIEGVNLETKTRSIETSPDFQGLGVQQIEIKGTVDVTEGFFFKSRSTVEVEAKGLINKETRAFGTRDPEISVEVIKPNQISTEFAPTEFLEGKLELKVGSKTKEVKVEAIKQGDLQITQIDSNIAFSKIEPAIKFDKQQIFSVRTKDIKTGDVTVGLTKQIKPKETKLPTQDIFAQETVATTDVFIKGKEFKPIKEDFIDVDIVEPKKINIGSQIGFKDVKKPVNVVDEIKIVPKEEIKPFLDTKSTKTGQTFEDLKFKQTSINKQIQIKSEPIVETKFKQPKQIDSVFETQIPTSIIKDVFLIESKAQTIIPSLKVGVDVGQDFEQIKEIQQQDKTDLGLGVEFASIPKQDFEESFGLDVKTGFEFDSDIGFKRDLKVGQDFSFSPSPTPTPPIKPKPIEELPKIKFDMDNPFKQVAKKKKKSIATLGEGTFVSSLGGLLLGQSIKEPPKTLTGLEIRGIRIKK